MTFATFQAEGHTTRLGNRRLAWLRGSWLSSGSSFFCCGDFFRAPKNLTEESLSAATPRTENPSAFMTASMEGVIRQLRDQEKELERLHKIERERAENTERLSEEVTRNMPAGLASGKCERHCFQRKSGSGTDAGDSRAGVPAVQ